MVREISGYILWLGDIMISLATGLYAKYTLNSLDLRCQSSIYIQNSHYIALYVIIYIHMCSICYSYITGVGRISLLLYKTKGETLRQPLIIMISYKCFWYNWLISHSLWSQLANAVKDDCRSVERLCPIAFDHISMLS